jgi:hypothetical protein
MPPKPVAESREAIRGQLGQSDAKRNKDDCSHRDGNARWPQIRKPGTHSARGRRLGFDEIDRSSSRSASQLLRGAWGIDTGFHHRLERGLELGLELERGAFRVA